MSERDPLENVILPVQRTGKSDVMEVAVAALVRQGRKVVVMRNGGSTAILPFKRPDPGPPGGRS